MILVLFGPPGSGKGTQSRALCSAYDLAHLSTGDLLRAERDAGTELGKQADELMSQGKFVPDEIVGEIVNREVKRILKNGQGLLFDGYPRNLNQLRRLDGLLADMGVKLDLAFHLIIEEAKLVERLTSRLTCSQCQMVYNRISKPPRVPGTCDTCGGEVVQRNDDDNENVIVQRFREFHDQTSPIIKELAKREILHEVKADMAIKDVGETLFACIEEWHEREKAKG